MSNYFQSLVDISVALGKGVYSVGEDIVYGIERTAEGLGTDDWNRIEEIGYENEQIINIIVDALQFPFKENKGPLYKAIKIILIEYYTKFPEETLRLIAEKAGIGVGFLSGRLLIGAYIARKIAMHILLKITATEGFKTFAIRLGGSTKIGKANKGIAIVVLLLMAQGVAQRASKGRKKLAIEHPVISKKLEQEGNLDLLFFLIEGPMKKHLNAIKEARLFPKYFEDTTRKLYVH